MKKNTIIISLIKKGTVCFEIKNDKNFFISGTEMKIIQHEKNNIYRLSNNQVSDFETLDLDELLELLKLLDISYSDKIKIIESKPINSLNELIKALPISICDHIKNRDDELPTFSEEQLRYEAFNIMSYLESETNYVAAYYGCGLIVSCFDYLRNHQYTLTQQLANDLQINRVALSASY